ncbi:hypothetical protein ACEN8I_02010 [Polaromonas sp. CT11-55]|uniref:hypothetical protein n=1 Tax=Polaromonas sp. CT11-55 TaxID=3243045 RepID=UPI0039A6A731
MASKSEKLLAVYARFAQAISAIPDEKAWELALVATGVPTFVAEARPQGAKPTSSQVVSGLEQGLRDMLDLIGEVDSQWRGAVSKALHDAVAAEYPEFLLLEAARLGKVVARGKIRTEAEFHLVRHRIDVLESEPELPEALGKLYALVGTYEVRD